MTKFNQELDNMTEFLLSEGIESAEITYIVSLIKTLMEENVDLAQENKKFRKLFDKSNI